MAQGCPELTALELRRHPPPKSREPGKGLHCTVKREVREGSSRDLEMAWMAL